MKLHKVILRHCDTYDPTHIAEIIGHSPKPATRTEGACASSALAFREGVFAIASGFYDLVLVGGVEDMS